MPTKAEPPVGAAAWNTMLFWLDCMQRKAETQMPGHACNPGARGRSRGQLVQGTLENRARVSLVAALGFSCLPA